MEDECKHGWRQTEAKVSCPACALERTVAALYEANSLMEQGRFREAKDVVNSALGLNPARINAQIADIHSFDQAFATACRKHNMLAAYATFNAKPDGSFSFRVGGEDSSTRLLKLLLERGAREL